MFTCIILQNTTAASSLTENRRKSPTFPKYFPVSPEFLHEGLPSKDL